MLDITQIYKSRNFLYGFGERVRRNGAISTKVEIFYTDLACRTGEHISVSTKVEIFYTDLAHLAVLQRHISTKVEIFYTDLAEYGEWIGGHLQK